MVEKKTLNDTVAIAKAIGIILMVLAHAGFYGFGCKFIGMFHMPLFFILSGYCFKEKYLKDFKGFAWRRVKGIYWPFVKWSIFFLLLHNIFFHLNILNDSLGVEGQVSHLYTSFDDVWIRVKLIFICMASSEQLLGGYWFLHTLFYASFIGYTCIYLKKIIKVGKKGNVIGVLLLVLIGIGQICLIGGLTVPYVGIGHRELMAAAFIIVGFELKNINVRCSFLAMCCCLVVVAVMSQLIPSSMTGIKKTLYVPYFFIAIIGTVMTINVADRLCQMTTKMKKLLVYIGTHTLEILTWHFLSFKLVSLLIIWVEGRPITHLAFFPVIHNVDGYQQVMPWWILYTLVGVFVPLFICHTGERLKHWGKDKIRLYKNT